MGNKILEKPASIARQRGMTLISLMVGTLISLLCISASLMLYKSLVKVASDTQVDSIYDGQLASALLTAQLEMQTAGFGILPSTNSHIVTNIQSGTVNIFWRYHDGTKYICRGFRDTASSSSTREFQIVNAPDASCTASATLTGLNWSPVSTLGSFRRSAAIIAATISSQNCWPYGVGKVESHSMVVITARTAAQFAQAAAATDPSTIPSNTYSFCLPNT